MNPYSRRRTVLVVGSAEDRAAITVMLDHAGWYVREEDCILDALLSVLEEPVAVVITGCSLPDGDWRDVIDLIRPNSDAPRVIVMSRLPDERLWAEVLNNGGFDLLPHPLDPAPLHCTVESAYLDWMTGALAA